MDLHRVQTCCASFETGDRGVRHRQRTTRKLDDWIAEVNLDTANLGEFSQRLSQKDESFPVETKTCEQRFVEHERNRQVGVGN